MTLDARFFIWLAVGSLTIDLIYLLGIIQFLYVFFIVGTIPGVVVPLCVIAAWLLDTHMHNVTVKYVSIMLNEIEDNQKGLY